jgi:anthranilate phosphoribosyltransferase
MSDALDLTDGFAGAGDDVYDALIRGHEGLTDEESAAMNTRLVLILANQVRDIAAILEAIRLARELARTGEQSG